ncbi:hypothetical protein [Lacisediminimonas profundi]|uniref:hypothetical protein n=1 Tax=Lacisediminimonas profundi TaxID=2603856 RepID=UPI0013866C34|nr:hypothetical protein [Lacisediminimonas profundi]
MNIKSIGALSNFSANSHALGLLLSLPAGPRTSPRIAGFMKFIPAFLPDAESPWT